MSTLTFFGKEYKVSRRSAVAVFIAMVVVSGTLLVLTTLGLYKLGGILAVFAGIVLTLKVTIKETEYGVIKNPMLYKVITNCVMFGSIGYFFLA